MKFQIIVTRDRTESIQLEIDAPNESLARREARARASRADTAWEMDVGSNGVPYITDVQLEED